MPEVLIDDAPLRRKMEEMHKATQDLQKKNDEVVFLLQREKAEREQIEKEIRELHRSLGNSNSSPASLSDQDVKALLMPMLEIKFAQLKDELLAELKHATVTNLESVMTQVEPVLEENTNTVSSVREEISQHLLSVQYLQHEYERLIAGSSINDMRSSIQQLGEAVELLQQTAQHPQSTSSEVQVDGPNMAEVSTSPAPRGKSASPVDGDAIWTRLEEIAEQQERMRREMEELASSSQAELSQQIERIAQTQNVLEEKLRAMDSSMAENAQVTEMTSKEFLSALEMLKEKISSTTKLLTSSPIANPVREVSTYVHMPPNPTQMQQISQTLKTHNAELQILFRTMVKMEKDLDSKAQQEELEDKVDRSYVRSILQDVFSQVQQSMDRVRGFATGEEASDEIQELWRAFKSLHQTMTKKADKGFVSGIMREVLEEQSKAAFLNAVGYTKDVYLLKPPQSSPARRAPEEPETKDKPAHRNLPMPAYVSERVKGTDGRFYHGVSDKVPLDVRLLLRRKQHLRDRSDNIPKILRIPFPPPVDLPYFCDQHCRALVTEGRKPEMTPEAKRLLMMNTN
ncbi:hypothetical protein GUITHDRAFT_149533 [Guillardia theta CCMP2712]|uniref:Uncharacterized protein n=1 Tax=Guillardia theta (strain CCMP2712) TaxID=905079 RepID=L1I566_GUITC|nr:hypothetical protein GUITHDRAFT_149533 [Guillardia theta CCMP2712]EKX31034.1 hypothetical protein GUITHDRAFT_149533 [Guillardia theta CCMP2712]|eukprot:XP_005818014.1 hypothetical protein GUITHDRAFT_149533 [Guillardia theta CCMP2712]